MGDGGWRGGGGNALRASAMEAAAAANVPRLTPGHIFIFQLLWPPDDDCRC